LQGAKNGVKAEDLAMTAEEIEEVVLKGKKAQSIYSILASARIGFKKLGIEILAKADGYLLKWKEKPIFKGDFKEVNAFWNKILKPRIGTGTGGVLKYLEVLSRNMVAQEHNMSCAAACIRQLAKDHGIELTEKVIREFARTTEEMGTFPDGILDGLKRVFKDKDIEAGMFYNPKISDIDMAKAISENGSWITIVRPSGSIPHAIIIDKIQDGKVFIRDPWPIEGINKGKGVEAVINEAEFATIWAQGGNYMFKVK